MKDLDTSSDILAVTGGTGFVGTSFLQKLHTSRFKEVRVIRSKEHDLRDPEQAHLALREATLVVHIAGITGGIEFTRLNQGSIYYDNILMNTNVLHSSMEHKVKKVISIGTVCSYPKYARVPFKEDEIWEGYPEEVNSHYGMAKKMLIVQGEAYRNQYGLNSQVLLFTNLYGPGDHFDAARSHVIPALIVKFDQAIRDNIPVVRLWGDGTPTRDLLFLEDATDAIICALYSDSVISPINVGSGQEVSIKDLAEKMRHLMGGECEIEWQTTMPGGQPRRLLDTSRAEKEIGFKARVSLEEGLKTTIDWYRSHMPTRQPEERVMHA